METAKQAARLIVDSRGEADLVSLTLTRDLRYFPDFTNNTWKLAGNISQFKLMCGAERMYLEQLARQNYRGIGLIPALEELIDRMSKYPQHIKSIVVIGYPPISRGIAAGDPVRTVETVTAVPRRAGRRHHHLRHRRDRPHRGAAPRRGLPEDAGREHRRTGHRQHQRSGDGHHGRGLPPAPLVLPDRLSADRREGWEVPQARGAARSAGPDHPHAQRVFSAGPAGHGQGDAASVRRGRRHGDYRDGGGRQYTPALHLRHRRAGPAARRRGDQQPRDPGREVGERRHRERARPSRHRRRAHDHDRHD